MDAGKGISVQEYLKKRNKPRVTCRQRLLVYINSLFALVGIVSFFIFLFLVPFVIDPSVTAILAQFRGPVNCFVLSSRRLVGLTHCQTWISCREGCTKESFRCEQIVVAYIPVGCNQNNDSLYSFVIESNETLFSQFEDIHNSSGLSTMSCEPHQARLLVNVKGCGYPPQVDCQEFYKDYGVDNLAFPCYYSDVDHTLAVPIFDLNDEVNQLALAIFVPFSLIFVSVVYMGVMFCGWCHCNRPRKVRQDSDLQSLRKSESSISRMSVRSIRKSQESIISHISCQDF